jgi:hypothetical protein
MRAIRVGSGHVRLAPQYGRLFVEPGTSGIDFGLIVLDQLLRAASDIARERRFLVTRQLGRRKGRWRRGGLSPQQGTRLRQVVPVPKLATVFDLAQAQLIFRTRFGFSRPGSILFWPIICWSIFVFGILIRLGLMKWTILIFELLRHDVSPACCG